MRTTAKEWNRVMGKKTRNKRKLQQQNKTKKQIWIDALERNEPERLSHQMGRSYCYIEVDGCSNRIPVPFVYDVKLIAAAKDYLKAINNKSEPCPTEFPYSPNDGFPHPCLMSLVPFQVVQFILSKIYGEGEKLLHRDFVNVSKIRPGNYRCKLNKLHGIDTVYFDRNYSDENYNPIEPWDMPLQLFLLCEVLCEMHLSNCRKLPCEIKSVMKNLHLISLDSHEGYSAIPENLCEFYDGTESPPVLVLRGFTTFPREVLNYRNLKSLRLDKETTVTFFGHFAKAVLFSVNESFLPASLKEIHFNVPNFGQAHVECILINLLSNCPQIQKVQVEGDRIVSIGHFILNSLDEKSIDSLSSSRLKHLDFEMFYFGEEAVARKIVCLLLRTFKALRNFRYVYKLIRKGESIDEVGDMFVDDPEIDYMRRINNGGRCLIEAEKRGSRIPLSVWPIILEMTDKFGSGFYENDEKRRATALYYLLREGTILIEREDLNPDSIAENHSADDGQAETDKKSIKSIVDDIRKMVGACAPADDTGRSFAVANSG